MQPIQDVPVSRQSLWQQRRTYVKVVHIIAAPAPVAVLIGRIDTWAGVCNPDHHRLLVVVARVCPVKLLAIVVRYPLVVTGNLVACPAGSIHKSILKAKRCSNQAAIGGGHMHACCAAQYKPKRSAQQSVAGFCTVHSTRDLTIMLGLSWTGACKTQWDLYVLQCYHMLTSMFAVILTQLHTS
eukprot:GHUV01045627.1.p1 GENE.GHUV01045627.1~~GHUV01045627.1.p1  ORF type:complete len:183 (-),score=26.79 GHUV01045627.1:71-619(-)